MKPLISFATLVRARFIGLAIALGLLAMIGLTFRNESAIEVTHHDLRWSSQVTAYRVVQLSDLHIQRFDVAEKAIATEVQALRPDLVLLTGDAIDRVDALPFLQTFLAALGSVPVVAVPGNWEHWSGVEFKALETVFLNRPMACSC
jgi:predicted MPP superfamily phosphohydrolase